MKIKLISDFVDIYDHWFCSSHEEPDFVFDRRECIGLDRLGMFLFFENIKLRIPKFGYINKFNNYNLNEIVLYLDGQAHRGSGKFKHNYDEALKEFEGKEILFSEYIEPAEQATSIRFLQIGKRKFWLKYKSNNHPWKSNMGDVEIENFNSIDLNIPKINHPIFAIDFIQDKRYDLYAIDFNISPGIKRTNIDISPKEIYQEIENWFRENY